MNYNVSYTLKHNEIPNTFEDNWVPFLAMDNQTFDDAKKRYFSLIESNGNKDGWHLFTINLSEIILSTDY